MTYIFSHFQSHRTVYNYETDFVFSEKFCTSNIYTIVSAELHASYQRAILSEFRLWSAMRKSAVKLLTSKLSVRIFTFITSFRYL